MHEQATYKIITKQGKFGKGSPSTWVVDAITNIRDKGLDVGCAWCAVRRAVIAKHRNARDT
jgi:hypothetical protein